LASSRSCSTRSPPPPPVSRSASSPLTRSSTLVRSSSRRTSGLPVQHLGQQVLRHRPLAAGELRREPPRIVVPGQRQRRQPQPGRPPLGPLIQHLLYRLRQLHPTPGGQVPRPGVGEPAEDGTAVDAVTPRSAPPSITTSI